ncbi:aminopeptidase P N-terminal domain-containing protein [Brumimicrobium aurantiacum]|uniref:Xaa-Pro aminopeptidase n=1 Tax=Brumimicrobium aurantiacum TaxID=1737063 RepID=A0A3E1EY19_9FLAO|nr:aminopeptidase P N-terminal domain-containing protein [Brumimicrobium aurantiacum]RFC54363.1 M24 family metallopeptidase [Brumimicrobium aurantiacum]
MKYERIDKRLFERNRTKFMQQMKANTVAIFNSNDIYPISADSTIPFEQNRDMFYLSGVDQEESILALFPDASNPKHREILFLKETNDHIAVWEGEKLTKEAAFETTGVKTVYWLQEFDTILKQLMAEAEGIYINTNEHLRANTETQTREDRFIKQWKKDYPAHQVHKSAPILHRIRSVKEDIELDLMQKACDITEGAVKRVLKFVEPGVYEHEIEAEIIHEFIRNRSNGFAYTPIIASGKNACVLHYIENNQQCQKGDVILMDFGAKYANYAADQTRAIPVSGRYTDRQKEVYNAVLHVKKESEKMLVPGTLIPEYHQEVGKLMEEQLVNLKLLDKTDIKNQNPDWPAYKKYFMHGTSHFIGLDTHDSGLYHKPIEAGMVFTCEPGIYIPEENLGIRLEDDLIIQDGKPAKNMMSGIPLEIEEVEDYMNS